LLEETLCTCVVRANTGGLPTSVISTGVALVKLELAEVVVSSVDEGHTERTETTVLGISLFQITQPTNKLLTGNVFVVRKKVALGILTGVVDENVGIGVHTRNGANHVTVNYQLSISFKV
jgi:hypothetical protein